MAAVSATTQVVQSVAAVPIAGAHPPQPQVVRPLECPMGAFGPLMAATGTLMLVALAQQAVATASAMVAAAAARRVTARGLGAGLSMQRSMAIVMAARTAMATCLHGSGEL